MSRGSERREATLAEAERRKLHAQRAARWRREQADRPESRVLDREIIRHALLLVAELPDDARARFLAGLRSGIVASLAEAGFDRDKSTAAFDKRMEAFDRSDLVAASARPVTGGTSDGHRQGRDPVIDVVRRSFPLARLLGIGRR